MYNVLFKSLLYKNVHYNKLENLKKIFHYIKESLIGKFALYKKSLMGILLYIKKFNNIKYDNIEYLKNVIITNIKNKLIVARF